MISFLNFNYFCAHLNRKLFLLFVRYTTSGVNMGIYSLSYKNLRRNRFRNATTVLRIAFGVVIFLILVSSGIGINTFFGQNQAAAQNSLLNHSNGSNNSVNAVVTSINEYIDLNLGINITNSKFISFIGSILRNIINFLDLIASIIFLIGIFGITNAMTLNLFERKREICLLKSLGFTEHQIILSHLLESGLLGFFGAMIGITVGIFGIFLLSIVVKVIKISILIPWWLPLIAVLITTSLSILLAIYIVFHNVKQDGVEALRYE